MFSEIILFIKIGLSEKYSFHKYVYLGVLFCLRQIFPSSSQTIHLRWSQLNINHKELDIIFLWSMCSCLVHLWFNQIQEICIILVIISLILFVLPIHASSTPLFCVKLWLDSLSFYRLSVGYWECVACILIIRKL